MRLREVFFAVCLILLAATPAWAGAELSTAGEAAPGGGWEEWRLQLDHSHAFRWGAVSLHGTGVVGREGRLIREPTASWHIRWAQPLFSLDLIKGSLHFTDPSVFRLVHRSCVADETSVFMARFRGLTAGWFARMPLGARLAGGTFLLAEHSLAGLGFVGLRIGYDTGYNQALERRAGKATVLQLSGGGRGCSGTAAVGWHEGAGGELSRALYGSVSVSRHRASLSLEGVRVERGFESLFAETNRLTPNRQGVEAVLSCSTDTVDIEVRGRAHWNVEGSRTYHRFEIKADLPQKGVSAELRIMPTRALRLVWDDGAARWQADPVRHQLRVDWKGWGAEHRLNLDLPAGIIRFQTVFCWGCEWRLVCKRDFLRGQNSLSARAKLTFKQGSLQAEWGEYDRGNLRAGFSQEPEWRISWEWEF